MKDVIWSLLFLALIGCESDRKLFKNANELIGDNTPVSEFRLQQRSVDNDFGQMETVRAKHSAFDSALIVTTDKLTIMDWDVLVTCPVKKKSQKGDLLYLEFYGKAIKVKTGINIGQVAFRYPSLLFSVELDTVWRKYATYALMDRELDTADMWIHCSFEPQTIALAGIKLYQFPAGTDPAIFKDLTPLYAPDPGWETDADRRIDSLRKGTASFFITDDQGKPIPNCEYRVEMIRHAFKFGTAITPRIINGNTPQDEKYREVLKQNFNHVVFEDHFKWLSWKNQEERKKALVTLDWLLENNFTVRGHTLVWPWYDFPWKLIELNADTLALKEAVHEHLKDKATTLRGKLIDWDVLNEPFVIRDKPHKDPTGVWRYENICNVIGQDEVLRWYKTAHEIDPEVRLFINDYDILSDGANFELHKNDLEAFIAMLLEHNAPLGGIGFQGHFEGILTPPEKVYSVIDRFSKFGLPILITEFDVDMSNGRDDELYRFTHDFLKVCFSHPNIDGFLNWGFWAGKHWRPNTALYDADWNPRANGKAWRDLIYDEWWTREAGKTDPTGQVSLKGFLGDYRISCMQNGQKAEKTFRLEKNSITWYE